MKELKFEANLGYQQDAIRAIVDIFDGQMDCKGVFTVKKTKEEEVLKADVGGVANVLKLVDEEIEENVHRIQLRNGLAQSPTADVKTRNFSVQMETGTGKTYVYLRSVFELNKQYGFTKFIVVVPSIAIKEGVAKSIELMTNHFRAQYNNVPFDAFVYNSAKLECVRNFAVSNNIQIMIINIDAFRKVASDDPTRETKGNVFHRYIDKMLGRPVDFVARCNPIVIIDEPQSVDNTERAREALALLNPLCQLRYSATHRQGQRYCMMYKLDSVDAYNQKLVKQIEVASIRVEADHNSAYVRLLAAKNTRGRITAKLELDVNQGGETRRKAVQVRQGDSLQLLTNRGIYDGYYVEDIGCEKGNEFVSFSNGEEVRLGGAIGGAGDEAIKKQQIEKTIVEHLDKELALKGRGIKVLSLFFLDRVENYRVYDNDGNALKGKYAQWFEEIYAREIKRSKYRTLFNDVDTETLPEKVHDGYFSIDKKTGQMKNPEEGNERGRAEAERGYELIMKNKTLLLSFDSPVKFIFSHSALKEGWDNPNVFQICTLNEVAADLRRRQMIGRGLRICVNQDGERVQGFEVNTLTVMANESFASFSENLQREIEEEEGIKFNVVQPHSFANMVVLNPEDGTTGYFGTEKSEAVVSALRSEGYVTPTGRVTDGLKAALKADALKLPADYAPHKAEISEVLRKICGSLNIKNKDQKKRLTLKKERILSPEFKALWDKIKYKTVYRVEFDSDELVAKCVKLMKDESCLIVEYPKYIYGKGRVEVTEAGVVIKGGDGVPKAFTYSDFDYPDVIGYLQNETNLTRKTLVDILIKSGRLEDFKKNPQMFIDGTVRIIRKVMARTLVDGIKYLRLGETSVWAQELFDKDELFGYFDPDDEAKSNMVATPNKGLYDYAIYDSPEVERNFAIELENSPDVKLFVKLPDWFKIPTPLGSYNPDWAVVIEREGEKKLYFVVETKGTNLFNEVPEEQGAKILCGKKHFAALGASTTADFDYYGPVKDFTTFVGKVTEKSQ